MAKIPAYFLPYQQRWLSDEGRLKIVEKSRRIGMTYVQAYEDVKDAARAKNPVDVWFSSADESAAREYILYCQHWAKIARIAGDCFAETIIDKETDIKTFSIRFATGKRINALSSNPKSFRSKGGKVVLDEFAFHENQEAMWKAALPVITWGYPVRILSTYNGKSNRYYRQVEEARRSDKWSLHSTTIAQAVDEGLADRIMGRTLTPAERTQWVEDLRATVGDEETWQQEYLCNPVDEATAYLTWDLIQGAEHPQAGVPEFYEPSKNRCYLGLDIARRRDLSVFWMAEMVGDVLWTREVVALKGASFAAQEAEFSRLMDRYRVARACIDQTGMGEQFAERAIRRYGSRVEGVLFTSGSKADLAMGLRARTEDRTLRIPPDKAVRESLHSVRKVVTAAGNIRFDADRNEVGHGDYFWAAALAVHGVAGRVPIEYRGTGRRSLAGELGDDWIGLNGGWDGF